MVAKAPVSKQRLVDTNLLVRYFVQDHERHAKAAGKLFDACEGGDVVIVVLPAVLAESAFVLDSSTSMHEIGGAAIHLDALDRYRRTKIHFVDCLIAATAAAENTPVASFDQDFASSPTFV